MLNMLLGYSPTLILIPCFKKETTRSIVFDIGYMVNLPSVTWLPDHLFLFPCFKMEAARSAVFEKTSFPPLFRHSAV
jgi:hypothetical protein